MLSAPAAVAVVVAILVYLAVLYFGSILVGVASRVAVACTLVVVALALVDPGALSSGMHSAARVMGDIAWRLTPTRDTLASLASEFRDGYGSRNDKL